MYERYLCVPSAVRFVTDDSEYKPKPGLVVTRGKGMPNMKVRAPLLCAVDTPCVVNVLPRCVCAPTLCCLALYTRAHVCVCVHMCVSSRAPAITRCASRARMW